VDALCLRTRRRLFNHIRLCGLSDRTWMTQWWNRQLAECYNSSRSSYFCVTTHNVSLVFNIHLQTAPWNQQSLSYVVNYQSRKPQCKSLDARLNENPVVVISADREC
jgi:hypothetical protein